MKHKDLKKKRPKSASSPSKITALDRESQAIKLRREGRTLEEIATALSMSIEGVRQAIFRAMEKIVEPGEVQKLRIHLLEKLEIAAERAVQDLGDSGSLSARDEVTLRLLKVVEMMARVGGIPMLEKAVPTTAASSSATASAVTITYYTPSPETDEEARAHIPAEDFNLPRE